MVGTYEIPEMKIACMEAEDVIRTSTGLTDGGTDSADKNAGYNVGDPGLWGN